MAYLLTLLPLPFIFLTESLPLRIMSGFIALLILFFVRESKASKDRPSEFSQIRFKSENPDEDDYEFFMDRFWQTQMAQKKEVTGDPIYLNSVDVNEIKREASNAHRVDGPKLNLSMVDLDAVKAEIARQMAESHGMALSLDMISAEDIRAEIAFEIAQERALQAYDSADMISLSSVDVNAIKATPLEINNAIKRLQQRTMQGARTEMQSFAFRSQHNQEELPTPRSVRVERRKPEIMPVREPLREVDHTIYSDDNMYRNIATPIAAPKTSALFNKYKIKPVENEQEPHYAQTDNYMANMDFRDQNYDPREKQQNSYRYDDRSMMLNEQQEMQFLNWQGVQNPHMTQMPQQRIQRVQSPQQSMQIPQQRMQNPQQRMQMQESMQVPQQSMPQQRIQRVQNPQQARQMQEQRVQMQGSMQMPMQGSMPMPMQGAMQMPQQRIQRVQNPQQAMQMQEQKGQNSQQTLQMQQERLQRLQQAQAMYMQDLNNEEISPQAPQTQTSIAHSVNPIQSQQQVMYVEPVVPTKAKNMEMAHALRMELIRRQREEAMQRRLALQNEPFRHPSADRRRVNVPVEFDRRRPTHRVDNVSMMASQRDQMSPVDIANENRRIMEMQGEKLRSMQIVQEEMD